MSRIVLAETQQRLSARPAGGIRVPAQQRWTPTGIFVQEGAFVTFRASAMGMLLLLLGYRFVLPLAF